MNNTSYDDDSESYAGTLYVEDIYAPKVAALLSILGSFVIIHEIINDIRERKTTVLTRILLSMSIGDFLFSGAWFLTTWATPKELDYLRGTNYGNTATCTAQGFFIEFGGIASLFFNTSLAFFYLLIVKYSYRERQLERIEKWVQPILWGLALVFAMVPLSLQMLNNNHVVCWIRSYPIDCHESMFLPPGEETTNCTRGDNSLIYVVLLFMAPAWICVMVAGTIMVMIFLSIRRVENTISRYGSSNFLDRVRLENSQERPVVVQRKRSRKVAIEGLWYIAGFLLTFVLTTVSVLVFLITGKWNAVLDTFSYVFMAMQGVWNLMNFSRKRDMVTREGRLAQSLIWGTFCYICGIFSPRYGRTNTLALNDNDEVDQGSIEILDDGNGDSTDDNDVVQEEAKTSISSVHSTKEDDTANGLPLSPHAANHAAAAYNSEESSEDEKELEKSG